MALDRFVDKDIIDAFNQDLYSTDDMLMIQLSRDIKELIKAIRSLKTELDGE